MHSLVKAKTMKRTDLFRVDDDRVDDDEKFMVKYLNTNEETLNGDVKILKEWMKTQPHLPEIPDEKVIKNFLILNKCSIERAKQSIDMYYTVRSVIPDVYENTNPKFPKMKEVMEIAYCTPLPKLTKEKYRIYLSKMRNEKMIDELEPHDVVGHVLNIEEIRLREDIMFGDVLIFDADGANFGYLSKYTPTVLWKIVTIYQKVFSIPMKAVIIVNSPPYIKTILSIVKNFVKPKVFQRIQVYQDSSILNKMFPKEILPKDYGGDEKSLEEIQEELKLKFAEYQDRFDQLDMMKVNEELRPQKLKNDEILGFYGNFKQLNVD